MNKKWYIVYTQPNAERKVAEIFKKKKIESYSLSDNFYAVKDNKKAKNIQVFKGYVFVKTTEERHQEIKKINEVINMVYWMGKPVTVKTSEIKALKLFLSEYQNVTFEKIKIKDNSIKDGADVEMEAPMITIKNKRAYVELSSLGYIMIAEAETTNVRIISMENSSNFSNTGKVNY